MNALKTKLALAAATMTMTMALAATGAARASETDDAVAAKPLTRAEVMADLQIWRESGLAYWQGLDDPSVCMMAPYVQAQARYERMRASPQFAVLVQQLGGPSAESVVAAQR